MFILIILLSMFRAIHSDPGYFMITQQQITVSGNTSFGDFDCKYTTLGLKDTLVYNNSSNKRVMYFRIPVKEFSCGSFLINKDFKSTIKADKYPHAEVQVRNFRNDRGNFKCDLLVELVGKKLEFPGLEFTKNGNGLVGQLQLSFERLELEAPKKLGGLIKVEERLDLEVLLGF
jgi:hypothetical protein